jgi:predicted ArsR family transcriptional regulator
MTRSPSRRTEVLSLAEKPPQTPTTSQPPCYRSHVLELLRTSPRPLTVVEIAEKLGVARVTVRRHLRSLAVGGYVRTDQPQTRWGTDGRALSGKRPYTYVVARRAA